MVFMVVVEFVILFIVIGVFNFLIYCKIRKRFKILFVVKDVFFFVIIVVDVKNRKVVWFLVMLVVVFGIMWVLYIVSIIIILFCDFCVDVNFYEVFIWLLWLKVLLNFFLYIYNIVRFVKNF